MEIFHGSHPALLPSYELGETCHRGGLPGELRLGARHCQEFLQVSCWLNTDRGAIPLKPEQTAPSMEAEAVKNSCCESKPVVSLSSSLRNCRPQLLEPWIKKEVDSGRVESLRAPAATGGGGGGALLPACLESSSHIRCGVSVTTRSCDFPHHSCWLPTFCCA